MADSYTDRHRLRLQETSANVDTWGEKLNDNVISMIDQALDGRTAFALSGSKTLSENNGVSDENRARFIDVTSGTGGTITANGNEKFSLLRNGTSGLVTLTSGTGNTAKFKPGETGIGFCDGTDFERLGSYPEWLPLVNGTSLSGTNFTYTDSLLDDYSDLIIILQGASHDDGSAQDLRISLDGSGATHSYFLTLKGSIAGAATAWAQVEIRRPRRNLQVTTLLKAGVSISTENAWEPNTTDVKQAAYYQNAGVLGSIKIDFGGTADFDAGLVYILARP